LIALAALKKGRHARENSPTKNKSRLPLEVPLPEGLLSCGPRTGSFTWADIRGSWCAKKQRAEDCVALAVEERQRGAAGPAVRFKVLS